MASQPAGRATKLSISCLLVALALAALSNEAECARDLLFSGSLRGRYVPISERVGSNGSVLGIRGPGDRFAGFFSRDGPKASEPSTPEESIRGGKVGASIRTSAERGAVSVAGETRNVVEEAFADEEEDYYGDDYDGDEEMFVLRPEVTTDGLRSSAGDNAGTGVEEDKSTRPEVKEVKQVEVIDTSSVKNR